MSRFVLDASAFAPMVLNDEGGDLLPGMTDALAGDGALVPTHWRLEIASMLQASMRRRRIDDQGLKDAWLAIDSMVVAVDGETDSRLFRETWALAERHDLTVYDAAYLELALRSGLRLATHDLSLIRAATRENAGLFGR